MQGKCYTENMKPWMIAAVLLAIIGGLVYAFIHNQKPQMTSLPEGTVIYDVRLPDEYARDHVSSAKLLPVGDMQNGKLPEESKDTPIAVYCHSGRRSAIAADILKKAGYKNVIDMHSIEDTANYGLSIVK